MHVFTAQLAFSLWVSPWLRPSRPLEATWSNKPNNSGCPVLARPQTRQSSLGLNPVLRHCVHHPQLLDGLSALVSPINHHLVDYGISAHRAIIADALAQYGQQYP